MEPFNQTLITNPRVYDPATGNVLLEAANNLSDVTDAAGARTNLDVYSTGEVNEYLAPKATAGGVRFEGANGYFDLSQNYTAFQQKDRVLTYAFNLKAEQQTFRQYIYFTGQSISDFSSGVQIYIQENSDDIRFLLRQTTSFASHYLVQFSGVIDGNDNHFVFSLDYTGTDPVITGFKNGQLLSGSVVISKTGIFDDAIAARDTVAFSNDLDGTIRDVTIFNRTLSATEVADLYRNGLAGIADADRWGSVTYTSDFSATTDGFASGGGSNLVLTGNIDAISGVDDTLRLSALADVSCLITKSSGVQMESGYYYEVEFDYYADSGSGLAYWGLGGPSGTRFDTDGGAAVVEGSWQTVKLKGLIQSTLRTIAAFTTSTGTSLDALLSGKNVYFKNITFTKIGAISAYPKDEGIGYQLHDISSNHYDGLLSTSGFTHLVPKTEGYIRDFSVDAYNGGSGNVNLVDSARDILPDRYTLSTIILRNGNAALVTGTLDIKVDGSSPLTIHSASIILDGIANRYSFYLALDQNSPYRNDNARKRVALTASDPDATNLDVRVDYKVIE